MAVSPWPAGDAGGEQLALNLGITHRVPIIEEAWWGPAIEHETEGDQDTGWWGA